MTAEVLLKDVLKKLSEYKRKYYINILLKGCIFFFTLVTSTYLFFTVLEYYGKFTSVVRIVFFFTYLIVFAAALYSWVINPLLKLFALRNQISNEDASIQIGKFFPEVKDKLLNALQLQQLTTQDNELITASITQKTKELSIIPFTNAVNIYENKKYLRYLVGPVFVITLILIFLPQIFLESTARILNYDKAYVPAAPFTFNLLNNSLTGYKNEDYSIDLKINGSTVPESVYIIYAGKRNKLKKDGADRFSYTFKNLQEKESFKFEAAGFNSQNYTIDILHRPDLKFFNAILNYPKYLNRKSEALKNAGNLTVPQGTNITWEFTTLDAEKINIKFDRDELNPVIIHSLNQDFSFSKKALLSDNYSIQLYNDKAENKDKIIYSLEVIPDLFPQITIENFVDSVSFSTISIGGNISDDYGLSKLALFYTKSSGDNNPGNSAQYIPIKIDTKNNLQNFFYEWDIDSVSLKPGEKIIYYVEVWDNDGVNGNKSTKSRNFELKIPSRKELEKDIAEASGKTEKDLDKTLSKSLELKKEIDKIQDKLKSKTALNWQDKKNLEDVLKKHEELQKELEQIKKNNESLSKKQEKLNAPDPEMAIKVQQLQKLMDELLDEETKKLYDELKKLLEQNQDKEEVQKAIDEIQKKDETLEKELERTLELFKQLKFDQKLEETIKDLKTLSEEQEKLSEKTEKKEESQEKLIEEQQNLNEKFKEIEKKMEDLNEINKSLENKNDLGNLDKEKEEVEKDQQNSSEQINKNQNKKAGESQKNAADKMKQMSDELSKMQSDNEAQEAQENMDDLRYILENLLTLSFDQEALMKDFRKVSQTDPRYVSLSQKQLKLKDDSKVIEDSLMALAKRVFQIESFVTREVSQMKDYMASSVDALKDRRPDIATGKQQFAMTSMNNLALLLNDVLKQMQEQMAEAMKSGSSSCKKPGKNKKPGLGEMQKELNGKIQQLKQSGKTGKGLSEELAKLAQQQEMIRKALQELQKGKGKEQGNGGNLDKLGKAMEETETDLVNKKITQETILRQQDILTRLLEAENAAREREFDNKREADNPTEFKNELPPSFDKYLKIKEKQIDLLKTVSPVLTPYYKKGSE